MGTVGVGDIFLTPLNRIAVEGGDVLHAMKKTDQGYKDFGEAYLSQIYFGLIKGWKKHLYMTLNLIVPIGNVRFAFLDELGGAREVLIGDLNYSRLTIPPGIWFAFKGEATPFSLLLNIADITHSPNEVERKPLEDMNFKWSNEL